MSIFKLSVYTLSFCISTSVAFAQNSDVESRVQSLENKMDAIIELLQKQNGTTNSSSNAPDVKQDSSPQGYVPGLYLDVYPPMESNLYREKDRSFPNGPAAASVGIVPTGKVSYAEIGRHEETKRFTDVRYAMPPLVLSGYVKIGKSGEHVLGLEISNPGSSDYRHCFGKLALENNELIGFYTNENFEAKTQTVALSAGLYEFKIYFECTTGIPRADEKKTITFTMAEPGDRAPKTVPADRIFIKE